MGKATNFNFGRYIHRVHTKTTLLNSEECALSEKKKEEEEEKPVKNFGENGAWAYPGTAQMF